MPRMAEIPLSYKESIGKRGVGVLVDECRRHIEEKNEYQRSCSPQPRNDNLDIISTGGGDYVHASARVEAEHMNSNNPFL